MGGTNLGGVQDVTHLPVGRDRLTRLVLVQCCRNLHPVIEVHHAHIAWPRPAVAMRIIVLSANCVDNRRVHRLTELLSLQQPLFRLASAEALLLFAKRLLSLSSTGLRDEGARDASLLRQNTHALAPPSLIGNAWLGPCLLSPVTNQALSQLPEVRGRILVRTGSRGV